MIHIPNTGFPIGTIIVAAAVTPRYYEFTMSLEGLHVPAGTKLIIERGCDITRNFNQGVEKMIGEWAWFLGDDHSFHSDMLLHFLRRRVDVVVPISPCKVPPWLPCVMHGPDNPSVVWHPEMLLYSWDELSSPGLLKLPTGDFIGQSGMLVKKSVLDKLGYPWFKCGQLDPGHLQEDLMFCHDLQHAGYEVHVDCDIIFDHYFIAGVTTRKFEGKWVPALKMGQNVVVLPGARAEFDANIKYAANRDKLKWQALPRTGEEAR